jgi:hypothetical protein
MLNTQACTHQIYIHYRSTHIDTEVGTSINWQEQINKQTEKEQILRKLGRCRDNELRLGMGGICEEINTRLQPFGGAYGGFSFSGKTLLWSLLLMEFLWTLTRFNSQ